MPRFPSGTAAPRCATSSTQPSSHRVGRCSTWAPGSPTSPANVPPTRPHTIAGPAAGTASRFAGMDATGSPPVSPASSGATASWAASVTASASTSQRGPGRCATSTGATRRRPEEAATESWNPRERGRNGSASTEAVTASARIRIPSAARALPAAVEATAAMAEARMTDGSNRVSVANPSSTTRVGTQRQRRSRRRRAGPATARTKATFWPDTTSRWVSPEARKSSATTGDWPRSSPSTNPPNSARVSGGRSAAPRSRRRRKPFSAARGWPAGSCASTVSTLSRPTTWRTASHGAPSTGANRPDTSTRSPASRSSSTPAAGPRAQASRWREPSRTRTRSAPCTHSGSELRVTHPCTGSRPTGTMPASARAARVEPSSTTPTTSSAGRRSAAASASTTPTTSHGTGTASTVDAHVAPARTTVPETDSVRADDRASSLDSSPAPGSPTAGDVTTHRPSRGRAARRAWRRRCPGRRAGRRPRRRRRVGRGGR